MLSGGNFGGFTNNNTTVNADGSFEFVRVTPGEYTIVVYPPNTLPNLSIVVDDKDIDLGLPAGPGFRVSGSVGLGPHSPRTANQRVILTGSSAWAQVETPIRADGKFQLSNVPAGTYAVRTIPGTFASVATIIVADREVSAVVLPAFVEIAGRVALEDGSALPRVSSALMVEAKRPGASTLTTTVRQDGM
jgi:hypothetical protein